MTIEGGDDQFGGLFQAHQRLIGMQAEIIFERWGDSVEHTDFGTGAEELLTCSTQEKNVYALIEPSLENRFVELTHHFIAIRVSRGIGYLDDSNAIEAGE